MKPRKIQKPLAKLYEGLAKREHNIRKTAKKTITAQEAAIRDIIIAAYNRATIAGVVDYGSMRTPLTEAERDALRAKLDRVNKLFPSLSPTVYEFDRLNRLDRLRLDLQAQAVETAYNLKTLTIEHLIDYYLSSCIIMEKWLEVEHVTRQAYDMPGPTHVLAETFYSNALKSSEQQFRRVSTAMISNRPIDEAVDEVIKYAVKHDSGTYDRILFTEGTRATINAVIDTAKAVNKQAKEDAPEGHTEADSVGDNNDDDFVVTHVYSTVADEDACQYCKDIAKNQKANPVPVEDIVAGENAPPFHPYCRCKVEVIYNGEY